MALARNLFSSLAILGTVAFLVPVARATVVDQFQLDGSDQRFGIHSTSTPGQSFTMGVSGRVDGLELSLEGPSSSDVLNVSLIDLSGGDFLAAPELATVALTGAGLGPSPITLDLAAVTATFIDFSGFDLQVTAGDVLGFKLASSVVLPSAFIIRQSVSDPYADGMFFSNGVTSTPDRDVAFKVFVTSDVPEPGTLGLFLLGGAMLVVARRRRECA